MKEINTRKYIDLSYSSLAFAFTKLCNTYIVNMADSPKYNCLAQNRKK